MTSRRKILVVGSGGREHALALRLLESPSVGEVVVTPGNAGTEAAPSSHAGKQLRRVAGNPVELAAAERPDLVVIGPEAPLAAGLADELIALGVPTFGPRARAARLESSKAFMKDFALRHGIPSARYVTVRDVVELDAALAGFSDAPVVKADGLCAGKGVVVAQTHEEARLAAAEMLSGERFGDAGKVIVLEEHVRGREVSVHAICDGEDFVVLPYARDHKRIGDGDTGPNTGGMGTYAPAALVDAELRQWIEQHFIQAALRGMAREGAPFRGTLFAGLMLPERGDPVLIEYNVRFGDPETQVMLAVMDGDFGDALASAAAGSLDRTSISTSARHALCVVIAAANYPDVPRLGDAIDGLPDADSVEGVRVYHAGTRFEGDRVVTSGGRVLGVTGQGLSFDEARARAYEAVGRIHFPGMQFRRDIGKDALEARDLDRKERQR
jgi:phosphoribosylamine---glycine ligase